MLEGAQLRIGVAGMWAFRLVVCFAIAVSLAPAMAAAPPATVLVTVRNQDGSPVQGGSASLADCSVKGSEKGQFVFPYQRLKGISPGEHLFCYLSDTGTALLRTLSIPEGQEQVSLEVRLGEEVVVRGRVVADDPLLTMPFAQVQLTSADSSDSAFPTRVIASAEGTFVLDGRAFEGVRMQASLPYHKPSEWVSARPPYPMHTELRCPAETVVLGFVLDEGGKPVPDAGVVCVASNSTASVRSDREGRFEYRSLPPGPCRFTAGGPYLVPAGVTVELRDGQQLLGLVIRLRNAPQLTVLGRVVGPDGVTGIQGAQVVFREHLFPQGLDAKRLSGGGFLHEFKYLGTTDETGCFAVNLPWRESHPNGPLWFPEVTAPSYLTGRFAMQVDQGSSERTTFPMFRGGRLRGTVSGAPDGARAELQVASNSLPPLTEPKSLWTCSATLEAATGQFDFGLVPPGVHWLVVLQHGDTLSQTQVTVREGEETTIALTVPSAQPR